MIGLVVKLMLAAALAAQISTIILAIHYRSRVKSGWFDLYLQARNRRVA